MVKSMVYKVKTVFPLTGTGEDQRGWYQFFEESKQIGEARILMGKMNLEIHRKGRRKADFSDDLIKKFTSGEISEEDLEKSITNATYSCNCVPCEDNKRCRYSTEFQ